MIEDYIVAEGEQAGDLAASVMRLVSKGYEPDGPMQVTADYQAYTGKIVGHLFIQVMIKWKPDDSREVLS